MYSTCHPALSYMTASWSICFFVGFPTYKVISGGGAGPFQAFISKQTSSRSNAASGHEWREAS